MAQRTPILRGLVRPKTIFGVNGEIFMFCAFLVVFAAPAPLLYIVAGVVWAIGVAAARFSPYFLADLGIYMRWRFAAWDFFMPDEGHAIVEESVAGRRE